MCCAGLLGGAGAPAGVPAEECGDGEQAFESKGGGADGPEPEGEERAGGHCTRAAGTTVSLDYFHLIKQLQYYHVLHTSSLKSLFE